jgi:Domain of unknown function (DUF4271)
MIRVESQIFAAPLAFTGHRSTVNGGRSTIICQAKTIHPLAKRAALFLFLCFQICLVRAQTGSDSSRATDTVAIRSKDTAEKKPAEAAPVIREFKKPVKNPADSLVLIQTDTLHFSAVKPVDFSHLPVQWMDLLEGQPYFNFLGQAVHVKAEKYEPVSYDGMFYLLMGMLFYFAIVKLFFAKYLANLLTLFFRASMRQQQLREQVLQSPFPSLLLNILFVFSGGLYGAFLLKYYHFGSTDHFWLYFLYCAVLLSLLYLLKFMILRITGWIFNINYAVEAYLFVVFMTNKIIGVFLLPFLVLISFSGPVVVEIAVTVSIIMVCILYIYRFVASYNTLHKEIKISGLHFFLYLCAFEIAPLLLVYKVLVTYLEKAY